MLQDLANGNDLTTVTLTIRPEDLTRNEPSRLSTQQTLGGAWVDNFGVGLRTINISGHTGWRENASGEDGFARFKRLNDTVFRRWHEKREEAINAGLDPEKVQLVFADLLDDFVYVVTPDSFVLKRNRTRPLLMQYQITMTVVSSQIYIDRDALIKEDVIEQDPSAVPESIRDSIDKLNQWADSIADGIDGTAGATTRDFMEKSATVLEATQEVVGGITGAVDTVAGATIDVATNIMRAGQNVMHIMTTVQSLPVHVRARLMEVAAAYGNAYCTLANMVDRAKNMLRLPDYYEIYGSSYCASTTGGAPLSPLRNENPFYRLAPTQQAMPVAQSQKAQEATKYLAQIDVLEAEVNASLIANMRDVVDGTDVE